ncbi:MAG: hybrid sensor histidine kinase/response regulator [Saprospirales bacterium]|nr:MAG: hybrid sensor histidine kinase/response regulator [Saprospirales bacterium]
MWPERSIGLLLDCNIHWHHSHLIFWNKWLRRIIMKFVDCILCIALPIFICWLVPSNIVEGQNQLITSYGVGDGLSQGFVSDLHQDAQGYLWIATKNGLNRFDGKRFKEFVRDPFLPGTLTNDYITCIREYKDFLILGTYAGGINFFHKRTQQVFHFYPDEDSTDMTPSIRRIEVDQNGNIWVVDWKLRHSGNLYRIEVPQNFWLEGPDQSAFKDLIPQKMDEKKFYSLAIGGLNGDIFISNHEGLFKIDVYDLEIKSFELDVNLHPRFLQTGKDGRVLVSHGSGLLEYTGGGWTNYQSSRWLGPLRGDSNSGEMIFSNDSGHVFMVRQNHETLNLDIISEDLIQSGSEIITALCDKSGNWWLSESGHGIHKLSHQSGRFHVYFEGLSISSPPFYSQDQQTFGFFSEGIVSSREEVSPALKNLEDEVPELYSNTRWARCEMGDEWILYIDENDDYKLVRLDAPGSTLQRFLISSDVNDLGQLLVEDRFVWVGLSGQIIRIEKETEEMKVFSYRHLMPNKHDVQALASTSEGSLWIGTNRGLLQFNTLREEDPFYHFDQNGEISKSLLSSDVSSLLADNENHSLWIGTKGAGLHIWDLRNEAFSYITKKEGLPNSVIYGIVSDEFNHLWMSTNNGIVRFDPSSGIFRHWTRGDGLPAEEFNTYAWGKMPDGRIMFGGVNGMVVFNPKDFVENPHRALPVINGIRVNNEEFISDGQGGLLHFGSEATDFAQFRYNQNNITFEFAALEFTEPLKNQFRFYLEGAEEEWVHSSREPFAQYLNLNPGKYAFKLMVSNNDGIWSQEYASVKFEILPPWYQSRLAWLIYFILVASILYTYLRFRINQVQLRSKIAAEQQEILRVREMNEFKTNLFTNITHEFRTPLSIILGNIDQLDNQWKSASKEIPGSDDGEEKIIKKLSVLRRTGEDMQNLVNQMLSLAKSDQKGIELNLINGDIIAYLRYLIESFHSLAEQKDINLIINFSPTRLIMEYDPELLRQVFFNLISNAVKYGPDGSEILFSTSLKEEVEPSQFVISVKNTGVEISAADLEHIFDRFYRGTDSGDSFGSGIGLALTKDLLQLMDSEIEAKSGGGETVFTVKLPFNPEWKALQQVNILGQNGESNSEGSADKAIVYNGIEGAYNLLIVEDNPNLSQFLADTLKERFNLMLTGDGESGLELALKEVPDIIISDVKMPGMNGFELCGRLKEDVRTSHIPVILLTGKADTESRIKGLKQGADAYISKPFYTEELLVTTDKLLQNLENLRKRYQDFGSHSGKESTKDIQFIQEDDFMSRFNAILNANLANPDFKLSDIGAELGLGRTNLNKKVFALTRKTPMQVLKELRLSHARKLLVTGKYNVSEAAFKSGFSDPKYFSRQFKQHFDCSPSSFFQ